MSDFQAGQGHYPYQATIDAYGNGGFRFAEMSHRGCLLALPTGMFAWDVTDPDQIDIAALARVFEADPLDVLLIGLGPEIAAISPDLRNALRERGTIVEAVSTGSAIRTYNVLLAERRHVGAALIAVDAAR